MVLQSKLINIACEQTRNSIGTWSLQAKPVVYRYPRSILIALQSKLIDIACEQTRNKIGTGSLKAKPDSFAN